MTQIANPVTLLASSLGEEGHKVAKGVQANWIHRGAPRPANPVRRHPAKSVCTVVRMIMTLDVDVTAERRHYNTYRPRGRYRNPQRRRRCRPLSGSEHNLSTQPAAPAAPLFYNLRRSRHHNPRPERPSNLRTLRSIGPVNPKNLSLHNPSTQPAAVRRPQPSARRAVNLPLCTL